MKVLNPQKYYNRNYFNYSKYKTSVRLLLGIQNNSTFLRVKYTVNLRKIYELLTSFVLKTATNQSETLQILNLGKLQRTNHSRKMLLFRDML